MPYICRIGMLIACTLILQVESPFVWGTGFFLYICHRICKIIE